MAAGAHFRIRNFERFQHYKDRNPPWIRLYGALWRDRAFFRLPDALKAHLIGLFSLAARLDNRIPHDPDWLAHELCATEPIDLQALVAAGFLLPAETSALLAEGNRDAPGSVSASASGSDSVASRSVPDGEAERQTEIVCDPHPEAQGEARAGACRRQAEVGWPPAFALTPPMRQFASGLGIEPEREFEAWRDDCAAHDRRYVDWNAAWRTRCRNAVRFGRSRPGGYPTETPIEVALRRLREASQRDQTREAS